MYSGVARSESAGDLKTGGGRDLDQLKQEILRRVEHGIMPVAGIEMEDARSALAAIDSLSREQWAQAWSAVAERHCASARELETRDRKRAAENYWRAWRLHHFARWPVENTPAKQHARQRALDAFREYSRLLSPPIERLRIAFEGAEIIAYLRLPEGARPVPVVLGIAGLDSRKEDIAAYSDRYLRHGIGIIAIDLPGTGEAPIQPAETGSERMFSAVLDQLQRRPDVDSSRIVVQGRSWSGHWAAKLAFTERARLRGAIVHGGPIHRYFQPEWIRASLATAEYLYDYFEAKENMWGARGLDDMLERAGRFSLLDMGLLDGPSAPMLIVNGARDSQVPISDAYLLLEHGDAKEAWINPKGGHMGRSPDWSSAAIAERVLMPWICRRLELPG